MHPAIESALETRNVSYKKHMYASFNTEINSPMDFAEALGYDIKRITKSVFIRSVNREKYAMAVCSIDEKLNFPLLADQLACKKLEVASKEELQQLVGYPSTGVAPIGLKNIPVFMDSALFKFDTVLVGAGMPKVEIEISPSDLQITSQAKILTITI